MEATPAGGAGRRRAATYGVVTAYWTATAFTPSPSAVPAAT